MIDSCPLTEERFKVLLGSKTHKIKEENTNYKPITIEKMLENFRAIYNNPRAMINARKRALDYYKNW